MRLKQTPARGRRPADATGPEAVAGAEHSEERAEDFRGPKGGGLVTDGVDAKILTALAKALEKEGAMLKLIAPEVGGVKDSDGTFHAADEKLEGGPSVVFDAVAILPSKDGASELAMLPSARDFVADAAAHRKFIAYVPDAAPLFSKAGVADDMDGGFMELKGTGDCESFVTACRKLRFWDRANAER